ncbi:MAG: hypothetical protein IJ365_02225 [Clostridia bacterium]|nr:hypothetical protein [Clostridia bacterium]
MKRMTVIGKILCVFKPKKTNNDILSEAENIINQYICEEEEFSDYGCRDGNKIGLVLNVAIIASAVVLAFLLYKLIW